MASCALCGKHTSVGRVVNRNRGYITSRTSRTFKPNLQRATLSVGNITKKMTVCTRCLRTANRIRQ